MRVDSTTFDVQKLMCCVSYWRIVMVKTEDRAVCDGAIHLHGNLYRVPVGEIKFADGEDTNSGILEFSNPRHVLGGNSKGFSKEEMAELREAIRTEGLKDPILLRTVPSSDGEGTTLQVVDGERRTRSLQKLVSDNVQCFDPSEEEWKPAKEMYEFVDVRINNMSDQMAFKYAFSGNERAIGIGDGATAALIRSFRNADWTDEQIMEVTGKSATWLRDTDVLIDLDDKTFEALSDNTINRTAALHLAKMEDVEERLGLLEKAKNFAADRLKEVKKKIIKEIESTESKLEMAKAEKVEAEFKNDEDGQLAASKKEETLKIKSSSKRKEKEKIEESNPKVTAKDIVQAKKSDSGGSERIALTRAKIEKNWFQPIVAIIKADGCDEEGEPIEIDLEDARLVKILCEQIEKGELDIVKILKSHLKAKEKRAG